MRRTAFATLIVSLGFPLLVASSVRADARLPAVFGDGMILQQESPIPVWGKAEPGERIAVSLGESRAEATADAKGDWRVKLGPLKADNKALSLTAQAKNTVTIRNVLAGEVWTASGQSNMAWTFHMKKVVGPGKDLDLPNLRFFKGRHLITEAPQWDTDGRWVACTPDHRTWGEFSATAFFFARELHQSLGVPVGIIDLSWGGLAIDRFMSRESLASDPALKKTILGRWEENRSRRIEREGKQKIDDDFQAALKACEEAWAKGEKSQDGRGGGREWNPRIMRQQPSSIFNCVIAPVIPYAIRGAIWWQGEWNASDPLYHREFTTLITDWRQRWGQGDFPFLFVQLQREGKYSSPMIREAFLKTLSLPKTGMAVTIDLPPSLHPREKDVVGHRLKLAADAIAYGKDIVQSGPLYDSMTVDGNQVRLKFRHVGGGLVAQGGEPLKGFTIAGEDRKFVDAGARIDGDTVVVSSPQVTRPVAARYGWANVPDCNLLNKVDLPASPFRTDDWPLK